MFALRNFRLTAVFLSLLAVLTLAGVDAAEARGGGSFGSRGMRTFQTVPQTQTLPRNTAPVTNTTTPRNATQPAAGAQQAQRNGMFGGGLGGWIMGGLLFGGLFGLMFGTGFGGLGGLLALVIQLAVLAFLLRWLFRRFGAQPQTANGARYEETTLRRDWQGSGGSAPRASSTPRSAASQRAGRRDEIGVTDADLGIFEQRLSQLQDAYSREDLDRLRAIGEEPTLECVRRYPRDHHGPVATDVHSFHVDSATAPLDTFLCSYTGASSEGLHNHEARRRVDLPVIRWQLLQRFGGEEGEAFAAWLGENSFDLHYEALPSARPYSFGLGNLWRIAVQYPGCPVPACIHRAPEDSPGQPPRLLLIS